MPSIKHTTRPRKPTCLWSGTTPAPEAWRDSASSTGSPGSIPPNRSSRHAPKRISLAQWGREPFQRPRLPSCWQRPRYRWMPRSGAISSGEQRRNGKVRCTRFGWKAIHARCAPRSTNANGLRFRRSRACRGSPGCSSVAVHKAIPNARTSDRVQPSRRFIWGLRGGDMRAEYHDFVGVRAGPRYATTVMVGARHAVAGPSTHWTSARIRGGRWSLPWQRRLLLKSILDRDRMVLIQFLERRTVREATRRDDTDDAVVASDSTATTAVDIRTGNPTSRPVRRDAP